LGTRRSRGTLQAVESTLADYPFHVGALNLRGSLRAEAGDFRVRGRLRRGSRSRTEDSASVFNLAQATERWAGRRCGMLYRRYSRSTPCIPRWADWLHCFQHPKPMNRNEALFARAQRTIRRRQLTGARLPIGRRHAAVPRARRGSVVWDADGKRYIDYVAHGAGDPRHAHPAVVRAVQERRARALVRRAHRDRD